MARPTGICHICGTHGPLSFEHIPPRAAFNDRPVIKLNFEQSITLGPDEKALGTIQQKGVGGFTLCERCNNNTGSWYGRRFVDWCYQGIRILSMSEGKPSLFYMNYMFPLAIIKQVVTMFFSVNSDIFRKANPELEHFVRNKEAKYLPPKYRFFVYFNTSGRFRTSGVSAVMNTDKRKFTVFSEITFPPYGYVLTFDTAPPDERMFEISHFARYGYNEFTIMELKLPVLPTHLLIPGDYRNLEQIEQDTEHNHLMGAKQ